jgi:hypothetical protein
MNDTGYHLAHETQASKVMYLDSRDGVGPGSGGSEFHAVFEDSMTTREDEGVLVSLLSATIPYSFYNFRTGVNDGMKFREATLDGSTFFNHTVTLGPGNYTATTLRSTLATKMTDVCSSAGQNTVIKIDYDRTQQKFVFSTDTVDRRVTLEFLPIENPMFTELGFTGESNVEFTTSTNLMSPNVVDINGSIHAVHIRTDLPTLSVYDSISGRASDILAKVTLNTNPGGIIFHDPRDTKHESLLRSSVINGLKVKLTDERDRLLSLNGLHFQVGLLFRFVSLKRQDPLVDLRRMLAQQQQQQQQQPKKNKRQQRKRALKKGKQKIQTAQARALQAQQQQQQKQTKTSETPSPEKSSDK